MKKTTGGEQNSVATLRLYYRKKGTVPIRAGKKEPPSEKLFSTAVKKIREAP